MVKTTGLLTLINQDDGITALEVYTERERGKIDSFKISFPSVICRESIDLSTY